jgi:hypothetical protein
MEKERGQRDELWQEIGEVWGRLEWIFFSLFASHYSQLLDLIRRLLFLAPTGLKNIKASWNFYYLDVAFQEFSSPLPLLTEKFRKAGVETSGFD